MNEETIRQAVESAEKIPGWMDRPDLEWLARQASTCKTVVEFGSFHGRSSKAMAISGCERLYCVDICNLIADRMPRMNPWDAFHRNLFDQCLTGQVKLFRGRTQECAPRLKRFFAKADMVFIDAGHQYREVVDDIHSAIELLGGRGSGGLLCGHDFNLTEFPGVVRAVQELVPGYELPTPQPGVIWAKRI